jgi:hypothetical protein
MCRPAIVSKGKPESCPGLAAPGFSAKAGWFVGLLSHPGLKPGVKQTDFSDFLSEIRRLNLNPDFGPTNASIG